MGACPHLSRSDKKKGVWGLAPASPRSCVNELTASTRMCHTTGIPPQGEHYREEGNQAQGSSGGILQFKLVVHAAEDLYKVFTAQFF